MELHLDISLAGSIKACQQLTELANSNFVPAFALLPPAKRQAMEILYAFTRFSDDIVDLPDPNDPDPNANGVPVDIALQRKKQKLGQWISALESVFGKPDNTTPPQIDPHDTPAFQRLAQRFPDCGGLVLLPAMKMIVDKYNIPREPLFHLIEGIESDIEPRVFATFDDSSGYCHQVATSVGYASLAIWGTAMPIFSEPVLKAARACGIAFQWTNIVRDLLEDYRNGRIYLPQTELRRFGLTDEQFGSVLDGAQWHKQKTAQKGNNHEQFTFKEMLREMGQVEENFAQLLTYQLERCEMYYENSLPLYDLIHGDSRRAFGLMWNYYYALYQKMVRQPLLVTGNSRIRLSSLKKLQLWCRWRFMLCRRLPKR